MSTRKVGSEVADAAVALETIMLRAANGETRGATGATRAALFGASTALRAITELPQLDTCGNLEGMQQTLRAFGYGRCSTSEQARTGYGLTTQRRAVTTEIRNRGWELAEFIADEGESGKDLNRPGVQSVLARLAAGEAEALVVHKLDRLTRRVVDMAELLAWSVRAEVRLVIQDLGIDTGTPNGRLVATIMAGVAEWEREQISARTLDAAAVRREQGKRMGRPSVRDTNPALADRIRDERSAGKSWQAIADGLNADGTPTVRGGSMWRVSSVQAAAGYVRPPATARRVQLPEPPRRRRRSRSP
ncbi:MAG: hypothetical protein QOG53_1528 [Frankiales bacterium]|jgi:DNA invertase Pin-like site-specific DNA recombinase|nr:hypothetical protein [Frankiales bacterium]